MYLRVDQKDQKKHLRKHAAVTEGPYQVIDADSYTVDIDKSDCSVERVSRSPVVLVPLPKTVRGVQKTVKPLIDDERDIRYPADEESNNK